MLRVLESGVGILDLGFRDCVLLVFLWRQDLFSSSCQAVRGPSGHGLTAWLG